VHQTLLVTPAMQAGTDRSHLVGGRAFGPRVVSSAGAVAASFASDVADIRGTYVSPSSKKRHLAGACIWFALTCGDPILTAVTSKAQNAPADPFVGAIAQIKRSVAPVICRATDANGRQLNSTRVILGSAFFISASGQFVTAAHVIADTAKFPGCVLAIYLPTTGWEPTGPILPAHYYNSQCRVTGAGIDVALCRTSIDLQVDVGSGIAVAPVVFDTTRQPDGTPVAFSGFTDASHSEGPYRGLLGNRNTGGWRACHR
jgi:hypothetical protein